MSCPTPSPIPIQERVRLVYVAGPYRGQRECDVWAHIGRARDLAVALTKAGAFCFCPHTNSAGFGGLCEDQTFLDGDLRILAACDGVFVTRGWSASVGARAEVRRARQLGLPVFRGNWAPWVGVEREGEEPDLMVSADWHAGLEWLHQPLSASIAVAQTAGAPRRVVAHAAWGRSGPAASIEPSGPKLDEGPVLSGGPETFALEPKEPRILRVQSYGPAAELDGDGPGVF